MLINFDRMPAMHLRHKTQKALTTCLIVTLVFQHVAVSCAGCLSANPCSSSPNQVEHVELGSSCPGCGCCQIATNATDCPCCKQKPTKRSASKPKSCCVSSSEAADEDAAREVSPNREPSDLSGDTPEVQSSCNCIRSDTPLSNDPSNRHSHQQSAKRLIGYEITRLVAVDPTDSSRKSPVVVQRPDRLHLSPHASLCVWRL